MHVTDLVTFRVNECSEKQGTIGMLVCIIITGNPRGKRCSYRNGLLQPMFQEFLELSL